MSHKHHDHDHDHHHEHHGKKKDHEDHAGHGHHHHHHHHGADFLAKPGDQGAIARMRKAFFLNVGFAIIELIGGTLSGSVAIVADAVHDLGDSASLALALYLQKKSSGAPSQELTYGYRRYSVLSSLVSGIVIIAGSILVLVRAVPALFAPEAELPHLPSMVGLSILGLIVNGWAAFGLSKGHTHNEKIMSWHLIEDFLGWLVVLIGALAMYFFRVAWLDSLLAIGIAFFIMWNVLRNLREPLRIILQSAPRADHIASIRKEIEAQTGVARIEELRAWTLDGEEHVFTTHLAVHEGTDLTKLKRSIRRLLRQRGYQHVTIEIEDKDHSHPVGQSVESDVPE